MNAKHRKSNVVTRKPEPDLDKLQQTSCIGLICIVSFKRPSIVLCCWGVLKSSLCGFRHLTSSTCQGTSTILRDHLVPKGLPPPQLLRWEGKDRHKQPVSTHHFNIHCTNRQGSSLNFVACLLKNSRLNYSGSQMGSPIGSKIVLLLKIEVLQIVTYLSIWNLFITFDPSLEGVLS